MANAAIRIAAAPTAGQITGWSSGSNSSEASVLTPQFFGMT